MATIVFLPSQQSITVEENTKILVAARRAKVDIRFGCASCRCGTCAVAVDASEATLSPPKDNERSLLETMKLPSDGSIRLACQARILTGTASVDISFQDRYSPDSGLDEI